MKVAVSTWSKFHFFDLARYLNEAGVLSQIFTNIPKFRLKHEGLPQEKIESTPFPAILNYAAVYKGLALPAGISQPLARMIDRGQQHFVTRRLKRCDVLIGLSGAGLGGGRKAQAAGGRFICERASSHIEWQRDILDEEFKKFNLPTVYVESEFVEKEMLEYEESDAIVVPSTFVLNSFLERGVNPDKIVLNPYGVDLSTFGVDPIVRADDDFRVLWVGQISIRKGIPYLLEAFKKLKHPRKRLVLVGAVQPEIRAFLATQALDRVEFLGVMSKPRVRAVMNGCDVFCIASIEEGMAKVTAEAMACGLPAIASANSGAAEILDDGVQGFIVPAREAGVMADRLQHLADDPALRRRMGEAARARVASLGGWRDYGRRYLDLIERLTGVSAP